MSEHSEAIKEPQVGRIAKRRRATRARFLEAAYRVMSEVGIDAAKIKDITDLADVGFGTFYNYFRDKDDLAGQVLDCLIDDYGRRNVGATKGLRRKDPALVMPISIRLVIREAAQDSMWQWWAMRPDLLVDRMRKGFAPFALRDMKDVIDRGLVQLQPEDVEPAWALGSWVMVGGIHDIVVGQRPIESESFVVESIMRMWGFSAEEAERISCTDLPSYAEPSIDWAFELDLV